MRPVHIMANEITESAADDDVGREVLARRDPREADSRRRAEGQYFGQASGILVGENARNRPCGKRMFRGKRSASGSEATGFAAFGRGL